MSMGFTTHKHLDLCADDEDPSQMIIRPGWDAPHVRCLPRTFCAWPCLLRQVGTVLGSPCDCIMTGITYANPRSRQAVATPNSYGGRSMYLGGRPTGAPNSSGPRGNRAGAHRVVDGELEKDRGAPAVTNSSPGCSGCCGGR